MNTQKLNVARTKTLSNGFLPLEEREIILPGGTSITREVFLKPDVVAILAISCDGKVYFVRQPRAGAGFLDVVDIPAGLVEKGENFEAAAKRELAEETGCTLTQPLISLGDFWTDSACSTSTTHLFLALNVIQNREQNLDFDEILECFSEPIKSVYSMLENGTLKCANSIIALQRAKIIISEYMQLNL